MTIPAPPDSLTLYRAVSRARELLRKRQDGHTAARAACQQTGLPLVYADRVARLAQQAERACAEARLALSTAGAVRGRS